MRRIVLLLSLAALLPVWASANSGPYPYSQTDSLGKVTVEGCLYASDGKFNLVDDRGNIIDLEGKKAALDALVGQRVRLRGEPTEVARPGSMSMSMAENVTTLRVSHIQHISGAFCQTASGGLE